MKSNWPRIEAQHGKPMKQILVEGYQRHGTLEGLAEELDVSQATLSTWLWKCGLRIETERRMVET